MIIDGTNLLVGRVATKAAKAALLGEKVDIVNCESMIFSGNKRHVIARYLQKTGRGDPHHGPRYPKSSDRMVRRVIRGMIPYKKGRGEDAYKRVMCYVGVPAKLKEQPLETVKEADVKRLSNIRYTYLKDLVKELGGKR